MAENLKVTGAACGGVQVAERIGRNVTDPAASNASDVVVAMKPAIKLLLPASQAEFLDQPGLRKKIEVPVNGSQADVGQLLADPGIYLVGGGVHAWRLELFQDDPALAGHADRDSAAAAYRVGLEASGPLSEHLRPDLPDDAQDFDKIPEALAVLDTLSPHLKRRLVAGLAAAAASDGRIVGREAEILRAVCSMLPGGSKGVRVCRGLPACFSDADCRKPGFVGECRKPGTKRAECVRYPAVKVEAVVVEDARAVHSPVGRILDSLRVFFPGLDDRRVDSNSPEGRELVERYGIDRLPAYLLDRAALKERRIDAIREALTPAGDRLLVSPRLAGSHQDITRGRLPGRVDLFLAPHSTAAAEALEETLSHVAALAARGKAAQVLFRSAVRRDAEGRLAAQGGLAEIEAMLRELAVARHHPDRLPDYMRARLESTGSSYWRDPLLKAGLDPEEIRKIAEGDRTRAALDVDAQELSELGAGGPVVLLIANQELVPVGSRAELRHALEAAGRSAPAAGGSVLPGRVTRVNVVPILVRALAAAPEAARGRIARGLAALTGEDFGQDVRRWKNYVRSGRGPGR